MMVRNYISITLRGMRKHSLYAGLNVMGLAVGLACFLLIAIYVRDEVSFDRFHEKADRIHRAGTHVPASPSPAWPSTPYPFGELLESEIPEIEKTVRIQRGGNLLVASDRIRGYEERFFYTEPSFFGIFDFDLIEGDAAELSRPNTVFLTPATARKYFGREDPIGKLLTLDDETELEVVGLVGPPPRTSHIRFDMIGSLATLPANMEHPWQRLAFTYLLLRSPNDVEAVESGLEAFGKRHLVPRMSEGASVPLIPLTRIHLYGRFEGDIQPQGDIRYIWLFSAVGFLVLLIACINYMNLATARSTQRAREIGIRKAVGARRSDLIAQFLGESALFTFAGFLVAVSIIWAVYPAVEQILNRPLPIRMDAASLLALAATLFTVALVSGGYPALVLSSLAPTSIFRGKIPSTTAPGFRKLLVVFQFAVSITLIAGTMVIERQLSHVQQKRLGFDRENVLVIETRGGLDDNAAALKHELLSHSQIERVSLTYATPGRPFAIAPIRSADVEGSEVSDDDRVIAEVNWADYDYASTLGLELIEGRDFSRDRASDEGGVIINETAQHVFGWDKPLGKKVQGYSVIGVVRDFHVTSLRERVRPTLLHGSTLDATSSNRVLVRLNSGDIPEALDFIKATWESFVPSIPFDYSFLDEDFDAMYRAERRLGRMLLMFTGIAVLLGCMGLFGMAAFTAQQRTKEIGIRKVLGATSGGIIRLLTVEFAQLVLIAALVAAPVAYVVASQWLEHFAYRVALGPGTLVLAGFVALTAAMATVAYHAWQAARMNPADSLRYE